MDRREGCVYAVRRAVRSEARTRSEASAARRRDRRDVSPTRSRGGGIRPGPAGVRVGSRARRRRETPARRAGRRSRAGCEGCVHPFGRPHGRRRRGGVRSLGRPSPRATAPLTDAAARPRSHLGGPVSDLLTTLVLNQHKRCRAPTFSGGRARSGRLDVRGARARTAR